jgi:hypothetical protein
MLPGPLLVQHLFDVTLVEPFSSKRLNFLKKNSNPSVPTQFLPSVPTLCILTTNPGRFLCDHMLSFRVVSGVGDEGSTQQKSLFNPKRMCSRHSITSLVRTSGVHLRLHLATMYRTAIYSVGNYIHH